MSKSEAKPPLDLLLNLYDDAQAHTMALVRDLSANQLSWRPNEHSSAIGWHLGHQAAVNHYLVRNLTAAEPSFDVRFDALFDSATPEPDRGALPPLSEINEYRSLIATSTHNTISKISAGAVGAPNQLTHIADGLLRAVINHEYQHAAWVREVRETMTGNLVPQPSDPNLVNVDGYWMVNLAVVDL